jgi:serine/threonine-protein kinase
MTRGPSATPSTHVRVMELARGGMGSVEIVLRKEGGFSRLLVRKRMLPEHRGEPTFRAMFLDEARIAGLVRHPNVVSVIDVGEDDDGPFLVMELVEGVSLSDLVKSAARRRGLLPIQLCVRVCADVARGLHAAHELRAHDGTPLELVHRDVTPQNVLLSYDGEVRVADFGIAKALGRSSRTSTGILKGKIGYMSPEQLRFREPDRRSDLFSLGVVLFEMLSAKRLYDGDGLECARRILDEPPPDIAEHRDDVPPSLVEVLFDLMAKEPDDRPATAEEVAARLDDVLAELLAEEETLHVKDYLRERFADERLRAREELDRAIHTAERSAREAAAEAEPATVAARLPRGGGGGESARAWKVTAAVLVALLVAMGIGSVVLLQGDAEVEDAPAPPLAAGEERGEGARALDTRAPDEGAAAETDRVAPPRLAPEVEAEGAPAPRRARTARARRADPNPTSEVHATPASSTETGEPSEEPARGVPRWSWD